MEGENPVLANKLADALKAALSEQEYDVCFDGNEMTALRTLVHQELCRLHELEAVPIDYLDAISEISGKLNHLSMMYKPIEARLTELGEIEVRAAQ